MVGVLITGGAGYIGSHAAHAFLDTGYEVIILDDLSTGVPANLPQAATFYEGDVADRQLVMRIVREHHIEGVLHFAGSIVVPSPSPIPPSTTATTQAVALISSMPWSRQASSV